MALPSPQNSVNSPPINNNEWSQHANITIIIDTWPVCKGWFIMLFGGHSKIVRRETKRFVPKKTESKSPSQNGKNAPPPSSSLNKNPNPKGCLWYLVQQASLIENVLLD